MLSPVISYRDLRRVLLIALPLLAPAASLALMWFNSNWAEKVDNFDPQSPDEHYFNAYTNALMSHTSGFAVGHVLALLFGLVLAIRPGGWPPPPRALPVSAVRAALTGAFMAVVSFAVAWSAADDPSVYPHRRLSIKEVRDAGLSFNPDLVHDAGFQRAVIGGLAAYPIWAVAGVALGILVVRHWTAGTLIPIVVCCSVPPGSFFGLDDNTGVSVVVMLLWPPFGSSGIVLKSAVDHAGALPVAAFLAGSLVYAAVLYLLARRRLRREQAGR